MKILQINSNCGVGSTGRIVVDLYKALALSDISCCIAYGREGINAGLHSIRIGTMRNIYYHALYSRLTDKSGFASRVPTRKLIQKIKEYQPDIIHLHNIHGYYINIELLFQFLKEYNKPVVWTLHDCWSFTGHCAYFDYSKCSKWKTGCKNCRQKKDYPSSKLFNRSAWNYSRKKELFTSIDKLTIVTPSKWLAANVSNSFLNKYPIQVIYNGINLEVFRPVRTDFCEKNHIGDKKMILGVANVWDKRKGMEYFIRLAKYLGKDYKIVLVGIKDKQKRKLPANILTISKTKNTQELAAIYTAADVLLNPTLEDNFPSVILESLACETPVVTFDTGGCTEAINDTCGLTVKKGDLRSLLCAVCQIKKDERIQKKCRERAENFDQCNMYQQYLQLYEKIVMENKE